MKTINIITMMCFMVSLAFSNNDTPELMYSNEAGVINPQLSPDGKFIAFTTPSYQGLYLWNLDEKNVTEISEEPAAGYGFSWSQSGHAIVFKPAIYLNNRRYNSLVIYQLDTKGLTYLLSDLLRLPGQPKWIDTASIYLSGNMDQPPILLSDKVSEIQKDYYNYSNNTIYQVRHTDGEKESLKTTPKQILQLEISPDGMYMAYEEYGGHLYILDIKNGTTLDLGVGNEAEWSRDSKKLVFMRTQDDGHSITESDIYIVNADGSELNNLTIETEQIAMRPTFSVDDKYIIYDTDANGQLYRVKVK